MPLDLHFFVQLQSGCLGFPPFKERSDANPVKHLALDPYFLHLGGKTGRTQPAAQADGIELSKDQAREISLILRTAAAGSVQLVNSSRSNDHRSFAMATSFFQLAPFGNNPTPDGDK